MFLRSICSVFLIVASNSQAAALYKCSGPGKGAISIQSEPCSAGSRQIWMRDGTPEPPPTLEQLRAREAKRLKDTRDARTLSRMAGTDASSNQGAYRNTRKANAATERCDRAKNNAQAIRNRDWNRLTVERLRQLDAWVESECKS